MSTELVPVRYSFGACEIDLSSRLLSVSGQPRHVERKTFELLLYLIEHRGRVVTKQELNAALWDGCVVSDGALTQCVWTARRAIDDPRPRGAMIQTHNGVGYRFAGHVTVHREERPIEYAA